MESSTRPETPPSEGPRHRRSLRIETDAVLDLAGRHEVLLDHRIVNINLDGLAIDTPALEPEGERVLLTIHFPDFDGRIETTGVVVWRQSEPTPQMGLRFASLTDADRDLLTRFLYASDND